MSAFESLTPPYGFVNFDVLDFDPEQPWDNYRALGVALNLPALVNGESTIKIQTAAYADASVTFAKIAGGITAGNYGVPGETGSTNSAAWPVLGTKFLAPKTGTYRIGSVGHRNATGGTQQIRVYVNGVATGTAHTITGSGADSWFYDDLALTAGDIVDLRGYSSTSGTTVTGRMIVCSADFIMPSQDYTTVIA